MRCHSAGDMSSVSLLLISKNFFVKCCTLASLENFNSVSGLIFQQLYCSLVNVWASRLFNRFGSSKWDKQPAFCLISMQKQLSNAYLQQEKRVRSLFRSLYRVSATWSYVLQLVPVFTLLKANRPVVRIVQYDSLQVHQFWQNARCNRQRNQFLRVQSNVSGETDIIIQSKCQSTELRQSFYTHETLLRHNFPVSMFRGNSKRGSTASVYRCRNACKW